MAERKTTSIKVNPQLWKELKKQAIDEDKDLSDILEEMIRERVKK
jgi:macrodomain Ter protein organizer (MatP/YcbG family)